MPEQVVHSTRQLLQRAFNVLLEGVPESINYDRLRIRLSEIEGAYISFFDISVFGGWSPTPFLCESIPKTMYNGNQTIVKFGV